MLEKKMSGSALLPLVGVLLALVLGLMTSPRHVDGCEEETECYGGDGSGEWVKTGNVSANAENYCINQYGSSAHECVEWCDNVGSQLVPSGDICCAVNPPDWSTGPQSSDCKHWVPEAYH